MAKDYWLKSVRRRHTNAVPKFQREQQLIESSKIGCAGHRLDAGKVSSALKDYNRTKNEDDSPETAENREITQEGDLIWVAFLLAF